MIDEHGVANLDGSPSVIVLAGKGLESLPLFPRHPEHGRRFDLYHYTDRAGFDGLTAADAQWLPSLGAKSVSSSNLPLGTPEGRTPESEGRSGASIAAELSALVAVMARGWPELLGELASADFGPGWYVSDLPPDSGTDTLLGELWAGDPAKRPRTEFWIRVRVSEFKVVVPDRTRPRLRFIPIHDRLGISAEGSFYGQSLSTVELVSAGRRTVRPDGSVRTERLCRRQREIVPALQFLVEGWPRLSPETQGTILRYFGLREALTWTSDSEEGQAIELLHQLAQHGQYLEALRRSEELIVRHPFVADIWSNRGVALAKVGRRRAAIDCYNRALEIQPDYPQARLNLAASLAVLGRPEEALSSLNPLISRHPGLAEPWYNRGTSLTLLKEWTAAGHSFQRFAELAPDHPKAARATVLARSCRRRGTIGRPLRRFRRLLDALRGPR